jgi:hypothetical protein
MRTPGATPLTERILQAQVTARGIAAEIAETVAITAAMEGMEAMVPLLPCAIQVIQLGRVVQQAD